MRRFPVSLLILLVLDALLLQLPYGFIPVALSVLLMFPQVSAVFLAILGVYLVVLRVTDVFGLALMSLAVLAFEIREMEKMKAPLSNYLYVLVAVALTFPLYLLVMLIPVPVSLEVTWVATLFIFVLYVFLRLSLFHG
ncbi:hypothetical protein [Pyrococcus sp. ST04]|uniref:hypothetical protein n=1 Tax=Pyrococcus sp. ST04 TaxID=1183377 RepID=UPI0002605BC4|nr:hypothetical protein [Pyrococcus sp. ST04]AFK22303.1 hypothetical protein Py04_0701 [Pyrococcus sp. ST04]